MSIYLVFKGWLSESASLETWRSYNSEGGGALIWQGYKLTLNRTMANGKKSLAWNSLKAEMPDNEKLERYAAYFDEMWFATVTLDHACGITTDTVAQGRTTIWKGGTTT